MRNTSQEFGLFIDNLRSSRNVSREDFVDGILSTRQFQRYLKGESSITNDKLFLLVDKLEMNFLHVYKQFISRENNETKFVNKIYNLIIKSEFKNAYDLIKQSENKIFSSNYNKSFLVFCKITTLYNLKRISKHMAMNQYKELINYPSCLEFESINFIELVTMLSLSLYQLQNENDNRIAHFLYKVLQEEKILLEDKISSNLPSLIAATCQSLGLLEEYEKVLSLTQQGIDICINNQTLNSLHHLYYYKALALLRTDRKQKALCTVKKVFMVLDLLDSPEKFLIFEKLLKKQFEITVEELNKL